MDVETVVLPVDHPGVDDQGYRGRRGEIAVAADRWEPGRPIPIVAYTPAEHRLWANVASELRRRHEDRCSAAFLNGACTLALPDDRIPQLRHLDQRLRAASGFSIAPVAGLVPAREFYGYLAAQRFMSTQYVRHTSVPFYTPEPDVIHEVVGHLNLIANPTFAELHRLAGEASRRCRSDAAHDFFSRVFWFTLEFGTVWEGGELKAYGAGLASSFGELEVFCDADIRPFDVVEMGTLDYDITRYQPVLFSAPSIDFLANRLGAFFAEFDDELYERLT
jgi:phenylalanine-4-hydroxylase